jgi:hypothetical protein
MSDEAPELIDAPQQEAPAPESVEAPQQSVYEAFKALPDFEGKDDLEIARSLYQAHTGLQEAQRQLQQYQQVVPYATDYARNAQAFDEYRKNAEAFRVWQQQNAKPAQPEEPPKWWNPPQVKDTWKSYIVRDPETGREVIAPDAPLEAQHALREYQAYTADFARRFVTNPEATLSPFIEQVAQKKAEELVNRALSGYQAQNYVQSLEQQNSDWLYDQQGNITREGQAIQAYIAQAQEFGIQSPEARWKYATGMLQRDLLNLRYQQMQMPQQPPPQQPPVEQSNMAFLRERATRVPNRSAGATEPRVPQQRMTFEDRLKNQLLADGVMSNG